MKKVILEYQEQTGNINDAAGNLVGTWVGLIGFDPAISVDKLVELKKAGFTVDDIVELKKKGLLT